MKKLKKEQILVLEAYMKLCAIEYGDTKIAKIREIQRVTGISEHTIGSWIRRHLEDYEGIKEKRKNAKLSTLEGLTEKETAYVKARMSGLGKKAAKEKAGYSEKTKAANIERSPGVAAVMSELRAELADDVKLGARQIILEHWDTVQRVNQGVVEEDLFTNKKGEVFQRVTKTSFPLGEKTKALKEITSMLGLDIQSETAIVAEESSREDTIVCDDELS